MVNWLSFRATLNSLPEGKPDEPNATYLIVNHPTADSNINKAKDALIQQKIVSILHDSIHAERKSIVKHFEVIRKGHAETHFEIKYVPIEKRQGVKSSEFYSQLVAIPSSFADLKIDISKDKDYYCTTTETFECLSALILMLISIFFFSQRDSLFKET